MRDLTSRYSVPSRYIWLAISMGLMLGSGCGRSAATQAGEAQGQQEVPRLREVANSCDLTAKKDSCPTSDCGSNGPIVNRFPVNGLHANGCKNAQRVWLVPGSIKGSRNPACDGHTLDVDGAGKLIAAGAENCSDRDLDGASFELQKEGVPAVQLVIHAVDPVIYYGHEVRGYKFTRPGSQTSVCDPNEAEAIAKLLFLPRGPIFKRVSGFAPDVVKASLEPSPQKNKENGDKALPEMAIVFYGELYDIKEHVLAGSERGWFNIACARDALAKREILKIEPPVRPEAATVDYYRRRTAALRMMTANYCNEGRYTFEGTEIGWALPSALGNAQHEGCAKTLANGRTLEAVWDENGAVCIEHTRLYAHRNRTDSRHLFPKPCQKPGACEDERALVSALWSECDKVKHSCEGITGELCSYSSTSE